MSFYPVFVLNASRGGALVKAAIEPGMLLKVLFCQSAFCQLALSALPQVCCSQHGTVFLKLTAPALSMELRNFPFPVLLAGLSGLY